MTATHRSRPRWQATSIAALVLVGVGFLYAEPLVVAGAAIPVVFAVYEAVSTVPGAAELRADRRIDPAAARPGEHVTVTVTVTNTGNAAAPDIRVIDGVPEELAVVDGSPRLATSLRAGASAELQYTVVAKRGTYEFDDPVVRGRSFAASEHATVAIETDGDTALEGLRAIDSPPVDRSAILRAGTQTTDQGGEGIEFYRTRDYQHGDPLNRLNWRQYAKTGELATIEYREEHATRTAIVVDARQQARVTPQPGHPTGVELGAYVSARLYSALTNADVETIVTAVGLPESADLQMGPHGLPWASDESATSADAVLDTVDTYAVDGPGGSMSNSASKPPAQSDLRVDDATGVNGLLARLPPRTEVVVVSPLVDNWPLRLAAALQPQGYNTTVVSPNVSARGTEGERVLALHRDLRRQYLSRGGFPVVDWQLDESIDTALDSALAHIIQ